MPRPPRIEFSNAWYHVMNRGAGRRTVFPNDTLKSEFVGLMGEVCVEFRMEIHAYCLMDNHFHLLIKTPEQNLNLAMQKLTSCYSRRHNKAMKTDGPLFKGRYKAILIAQASYLAEVSRYIHRNPIEASLVRSPRDYRWSSFPIYCGIAEKHEWLSCSEVVRYVSPRSQTAEYLRFVENDRLASMSKFYNSPRLPGILGNKAARRLVENKTGYHDTWYPKDRIPLTQIIDQVANISNLPNVQIVSSTKGSYNPWRSVAMHIAQVRGRYSTKEIAASMGVKTSTVTQALSRFRRDGHKNEVLLKAVENLTCIGGE